ncbi:unnamed protein product [Blepharisma stoltei]|uniref:Uncharacterized protein n=1 Tax=Blepharisma stoltei TaxID=1481888 RepID=A0AAU9K0Z3_9CILI|nr:unnamed protein product [Blepharisma stoltei]
MSKLKIWLNKFICLLNSLKTKLTPIHEAYNYNQKLKYLDSYWQEETEPILTSTPSYSEIPLKKQKLSEGTPVYQGHESMFGEFVKTCPKQPEKIIKIPLKFEISTNTPKFQEIVKHEFSPKKIIPKVTHIDAEEKRRKVMSEFLPALKKKASFYNVNLCKRQRDAFYDSVANTPKNDNKNTKKAKTKEAYKTMPPILEESKNVKPKASPAKNNKKSSPAKKKETVITPENFGCTQIYPSPPITPLRIPIINQDNYCIVKPKPQSPNKNPNQSANNPNQKPQSGGSKNKPTPNQPVSQETTSTINTISNTSQNNLSLFVPLQPAQQPTILSNPQPENNSADFFQKRMQRNSLQTSALPNPQQNPQSEYLGQVLQNPNKFFSNPMQEIKNNSQPVSNSMPLFSQNLLEISKSASANFNNLNNCASGNSFVSSSTQSTADEYSPDYMNEDGKIIHDENCDPMKVNNNNNKNSSIFSKTGIITQAFPSAQGHSSNTQSSSKSLFGSQPQSLFSSQAKPPTNLFQASPFSSSTTLFSSIIPKKTSPHKNVSNPLLRSK